MASLLRPPSHPDEGLKGASARWRSCHWKGQALTANQNPAAVHKKYQLFLLTGPA